MYCTVRYGRVPNWTVCTKMVCTSKIEILEHKIQWTLWSNDEWNTPPTWWKHPQVYMTVKTYPSMRFAGDRPHIFIHTHFHTPAEDWRSKAGVLSITVIIFRPKCSWAWVCRIQLICYYFFNVGLICLSKLRIHLKLHITNFLEQLGTAVSLYNNSNWF